MARTDAFLNLAPKLGLSFDLRDGMLAYLNASVGFRPPEMTELYRLQRGQAVADLQPETLDMLEAGWRRESERGQVEFVAYTARKDNFIFRDANGFNASDGRRRRRPA